MKKVSCLMLVILLTFSSMAIAEFSFPKIEEDFSIRNGIRFGMTREEIITLENATLQSDKNNSVKYSDVTLMGIKKVYLDYYFTSSNKMSGFVYHTLAVPGIDFDSFSAILCQKYGDPFIRGDLISKYSTPAWLSDATKSLIRGEYDPDTLWVDIAGVSKDGTVKLTDYASWYIEYPDGFLMIEFVECNNKWTGLGYSFLSHTQMEQWLNEINKKTDEINKSFTNDL